MLFITNNGSSSLRDGNDRIIVNAEKAEMLNNFFVFDSNLPLASHLMIKYFPFK